MSAVAKAPAQRRQLLAGVGAAVLAAAGGTVSAPGAPASPSGGDAELIAACRQHVINLRALAEVDRDIPDDHPVWLAYDATHDAISNAQPQTVIGKPADDDIATYRGLGRVIERLAERVGVDLQEVVEFERPDDALPESHPHWRPNGRMLVFRHPVFGADQSLVAKGWLSQFLSFGGGVTFRVLEHRD